MKAPKIFEKLQNFGKKATMDISDKTKEVVGHTTRLAGGFTKNTTKGLDRMKVVFAKPLVFEKRYELSHQEEAKTDGEIDFLLQALKESNEFIFQHLTEKECSRLIAAMELIHVDQGSLIIKQGDVGDYLYILKNGKLSFIVDRKEVGSTEEPKSIFGELALLYDAPRAATVKAMTDCDVYRVSQHAFRRIQAAHVLEGDEETNNLLKETKLFQGLDQEYIEAIATSLIKHKYKKGDVIVTKGEEITFLLIVKEGEVKATDISIGSTKFADIKVGPGRVVGERAIIYNEPSVGNLTAATNCEVFVLSKERFYRILGHLDLEQMLKRALDIKYLVSTSTRMI
jgi:cAMP-dependent protein kinase regulator